VNNSPTQELEQSLVEHFGAANSLARWLLRNSTEAEDAVQEAYLRALRYFQNFRGEDCGHGSAATAG
jgi:RNA polymerase sigma-70 factor (ECF subfamily)